MSDAELVDHPFLVVSSYIFVNRLLDFYKIMEVFFVSVEHLFLHLRKKTLP